MQLVHVLVCMQPDVVDVTDQDCMTALCDTMLVHNLEFQPSPRLNTTICFPTCIIPTEIKFVVLCDKIDVVNNISPYVIKFVSWIVTVLYSV